MWQKKQSPTCKVRCIRTKQMKVTLSGDRMSQGQPWIGKQLLYNPILKGHLLNLKILKPEQNSNINNLCVFSFFFVVYFVGRMPKIDHKTLFRFFVLIMAHIRVILNLCPSISKKDHYEVLSGPRQNPNFFFCQEKKNT